MRLLAAALAGVLLLALPADAAKLSERAKQKRAAENARSGLQQKLNDLKRDIQKTESAKGHASDDLAKSEQAISETNRSLYELAGEQRETQAKIAQLTAQQVKLEAAVKLQQTQLATLARQQYASGNEDRTKLLLSGDNPNRIQRELRYLGYVAQAQAKLIASLQANLQAIETSKEETETAKQALDEIAEETAAQKSALEQEKGRHATLVAQLSNKLATQKKAAGAIERDEQRLGKLVNKLAQLIEEQQKAEAAERLRRQRQAEAKRHARNKGKKGATKGGNITSPDAIDDDEPPKTLAHNDYTPQASVQTGVNFASLRGRLRLPVRGDLIAKYGSRRDDGPAWKGLFIRTAEGAEVKAVAAGRVVFADWLRGFGNLIIIDHGGQYLTIYGNNQAVLKHAGDNVKTGDVIANAGNSGGNAQSGLYFEMRYQGRAFDPLEWISLR
ncbi:MAG: peptidoglycan DD-metalloendopeptidase family protein [Proteobacteria bacterium]|nr:peptidoglycan DD-metalloendopeptidase family protein [Pseudomonadota bacterium]